MKQNIQDTGAARFDITLNASGHAWAEPDVVTGGNIGTLGHVLPFPDAAVLAQKHGFDALNLCPKFLADHGSAAVRHLLLAHGLRPGGFRLPVPLSDDADDESFTRRLRAFEIEAPEAAAAGYKICAYHILPYSSTGRSFGAHFRLAADRLARLAPILRDTGLRAGFEFIGPYGLRRYPADRVSFIHTLEGVRSLISAVGAEDVAGIKLDSYHWFHTGGRLEDILGLTGQDVVYVELNDFPLHAAHLTTPPTLLETPELDRELPLSSHAAGAVDTTGLIAALRHIGYRGAVAAEPFSRRVQRLSAEDAVRDVAKSLKRVISSSAHVTLGPELIGEHFYHAEPVTESIAPPPVTELLINRKNFNVAIDQASGTRVRLLNNHKQRGISTKTILKDHNGLR